MQQGQHERKIKELAARTGDKLPPKIANRPTILPGLEVYWKAFWECSRDRAVGMGEGPIPWASVNEWAKRYDYWDAEFDRLVYIIFKMDGTYMDERGKQQEKKMKRGSKSKTPIKTTRTKR